MQGVARLGLALFAWAMLTASMPANAVTYTNAATTFSWIDASTHTQVGPNTSPYKFSNTGGCGTTAPVIDDSLSDNIPLGFTFNYGGVDFTQVRIMSNGRLQFNNNMTCGYGSPVTQLPYPNAGLDYTMRIYGNDLDPTAKSEVPAYSTNCLDRTTCYVSYASIGTAPNRRFVVTWYHVPEWTAASTAGGSYDLQIILQENGEFIYQFGSDVAGPGNINAQVGWQVNSSDYAVPNVGFPANNSAIRFYIPSPLSELRMDEGAWSGAGSVVNSSGGTNSSPVGAAQTVAGGKICRGGNIPSNTTTAAIDAVDTGYDVDSQIGSSGTISFWYKSNSGWNGAGSQDSQLLDATVTNNRWFYLVKQNGNGRLSFNLTDNANNNFQVNTGNYAFAANTWVHIAVSWNLTPVAANNRLRIYVNGALAQSVAIGTTQPLSSAIGTLFVGDNRSSFVTNPGTGNSANGVMDEVHIYNYETTGAIVLRDYNASRSCPAVDHIQIEHASGSGVTCASTSLTVKACADAACSVLYTGGVSGTLTATGTPAANWDGSTGGASGAGFVILPGNSIVGKNVQVTPAGTVVFGTTGLSPAPSGSTTCNFGSPACTYTANTAGFIFSSTATGGAYTVPAQVSGIATGTLYLRAVQASTTNPAVCTPAIISQTTSVDMGYTCSDPITCQAGSLATINSTAVASSGTSVSLVFDANASAPITIRYDDAGKIALNASKSITPTGGTAVTLNGSSNAFVVAPHHFGFSAVTAAPIKAGNNFSATVTAYNGLGTPTATRNFGKEISAEGVTLSFVKYQPTGAGAVSGNFSGSMGAFNNGVATSSNLNWSEVGTIDLSATLTSGSYLGSTLTATGSTGSTGAVGRFIPDHFDVTVTQGCSTGGFTYSAQPFTVKVSAMNGLIAPTKTQNYDGSSNTSPNFSKDVTLSEVNAVAGSLSPVSVAANAFMAGEANATPVFTFTVLPTAPSTIKLRAVDTDSVSSQNGAEGTASIRSGRLQLQNAYGSELLDLPVTLRAQYWNGSAWIQNSDDSCTTMVAPTSGAGLTFYPEVAAGVMGNHLSATETTASVNASGKLAAGSAGLKFSKPGSGNSGYVDIAIPLASQAWLQYPWTGAGNVNPSGRATFGIYKSKLIYIRENY
jgi:MSHA biogenesis protein MshQ